ncbi:MAG: LysE family transporter [Legionellales bacterium]|nr:LysE family transporter [Legionellales bacterium]
MFDLFHSFYMVTLVQIILLNLVALVSPGPDFAVVAHNSLAYGRRIGIVTALGITLGEFIHLSYIVLGFGSIIKNHFWLLAIIKILGCLYLVTLGLKMVFSRSNKNQISDNDSDVKILSTTTAIFRGALTNILNPKAILFFLSIFSVVVDVDTPMSIMSIYGLAILLTTFFWFGFVAVFFSTKKINRKITSIKYWINKITGSMLILLSIKLALTEETS